MEQARQWHAQRVRTSACRARGYAPQYAYLGMLPGLRVYACPPARLARRQQLYEQSPVAHAAPPLHQTPDRVRASHIVQQRPASRGTQQQPRALIQRSSRALANKVQRVLPCLGHSPTAYCNLHVTTLHMACAAFNAMPLRCSGIHNDIGLEY